MGTLGENLSLGWHSQVPMILQTEASECGLASLAMIAQYFGYRADLLHLRRRFGMSLKGATLKDLVRVGEQIGLGSRPLRLEISELKQLRLPCVRHWDLNHFVVLKSVGHKSIVIHDPAVGVRRLPLETVSRYFTGVALELMPTSEFKPAASPPRVRTLQLLGHLHGAKRALTQLFGLALVMEVFAMISPFFLSWVVDHALVSEDRV
jgi:ATP-binding cassette, subfamily B, bacterial CvaB/MchF/RaxB